MKRPWNIIDEAVYSLVTTDQTGKCNMNICTYVTPVSMQPKLYAIGIYFNTKTHDNILRNDKAVLQILHQSQAKLVNVLGKKSGRSYDKMTYLARKKLVTSWNGFEVLQDAISYIQLEKLSHQVTGDHDLHIFKVTKSSQPLNDQVLTTRDLSAQSIISI